LFNVKDDRAAERAPAFVGRISGDRECFRGFLLYVWMGKPVFEGDSRVGTLKRFAGAGGR
jgi:hypothetical protein